MNNNYISKFLKLTLIFLVLGSHARAQLVIEWQKCYGGSGFDQPFTTEKTRDGGIISAGFSESTDGDITGNLGNYDWWIVKTDPNGNVEWARNYGGNNYDKCRAIMQNDDGTYIAFGSSHSSNGDLYINHGEADFWVLKLDSLGNILENLILGGSAEEGGRGVIRTTDRGWMLVGWAASNDGDIVGNHGSKDAWLCKLDSNFNVQWNKCYGGSMEDRARYVIQLADGGYVLGGNSKSNDGDVSVNKGGEDFWILRVDSVGTLLWQTALGTSVDDRIYYVAPDWDGGFLGIGRNGANDGDVNDNHGEEDLWIIKVDSLGAPVWTKSLGGSLDDGGFRIESTPDHGYFITGTTKSIDGDSPGTYGISDYWFIKLDSALNFVWNDHIGGKRADHCNDIIKTDDGGYYMTGFALSNDTLPYAFGNHGEADYWFAKVFFCENKDTVLAQTSQTICPGTTLSLSTATTFDAYTWSTGDTTNSIAVSQPGDYWVNMSDFKGYCQFNSDTFHLTNYPAPAIPVITEFNGDLSTSGAVSYQWNLNGNPIPGETNATLTNITQSGIYTVTITDGNGCTETSAGYQYAVGLSEVAGGFNLSAYPNPFNQSLEIQLQSPVATSVEFTLSDLSGKVCTNMVSDVQTGNNKITLTADDLAAGAYNLTVSISGKPAINKLILRR